MKSTIVIVGILALMFSTSLGRAQSPVSYFLFLEGIRGESNDQVHKDWSDVTSFTHGVTYTVQSHGGGAGTGRSQFQSIVVTKPLDKASTSLILACAKGTRISRAMLACAKPGAGPHDFYKITLDDVVIVGVNVFGDKAVADGLPKEEVSLTFKKIKWEYTPAQGSVTVAEWDVSTNTGH